MDKLQQLALFLRNLSRGDDYAHDIVWSLAVGAPETKEGEVLFVGSLIKGNLDVSFCYDNARGISLCATYINNEIVSQYESMSFNEFKEKMQTLFGVKKLYKENV